MEAFDAAGYGRPPEEDDHDDREEGTCPTALPEGTARGRGDGDGRRVATAAGRAIEAQSAQLRGCMRARRSARQSPPARKVAHLTVEQRVARGRAARNEVPRSAHAGF